MEISAANRANLMEWQAELIGMFLDCASSSNEETIDNVRSRFSRASMIKNRILFMVELDQMKGPNGLTALDNLLAMETNSNETWENGNRPENIAFALDDMLKFIKARYQS